MKKLLITAMTVILTALQTVAQEEPKTGWVFTPFPDVSYNSDIGLNLGGFCDFLLGESTAHLVHGATEADGRSGLVLVEVTTSARAQVVRQVCP